VITYEIEGIPRPQGSKRHIGGGVMLESSKYVANWRAYAKLKAVEAMRTVQRIEKPHGVQLEVAFVFDRPLKHFTKKGLRSEAPKYYTIVPDADKVLRALLDSMSGVVFGDDSQVCVLSVSKTYGKAPTTIVRVSKVEK
jgi:crossover junction endodeoxyribonuclease RusA